MKTKFIAGLKRGRFMMHGMFVLLLIATSLVTYSQQKVRTATRQTALEAFSRENFSQAYEEFTELSRLYPKDPLYKYYCGVCLVKLQRDPGGAVNLLQEAIKGSAVIRSVPDDGYFYLGRANQMSGNFNEAIRSYETFSSQAGRRTAREMNVQDLIQQCNDGRGKLVSEVPAADSADKSNIIMLAGNKGEFSTAKKDEATIAGEDPPVTDTLPEPYEKLLSEALKLQIKSDSVEKIAEGYRKEMQKVGTTERDSYKTKIDTLEEVARANREKADLMLAEAQNLSDKIPDKESEFPTVEILKRETENSVDTLKTFAGEIEKTSDRINIVTDKQKSVPVFSEFNVVEKTSDSSADEIVINPGVPPGLIYRIQVAVFRNPVTPTYFKGITPVQGFKTQGSDLTYYYAGIFRKSADAAKALTRVRSRGFKDAFIAALMDKKVISSERAAVLEKEWGAIPLYEKEPGASRAANDTVPLTLMFRVEIMKSQKPLPPDQVETIRRLAGNRGFDIITDESKGTIYLIGSFISYKSATEYTDLLQRNGYKNARVTAYLGNREIDVEIAKQLFEEY